MYTRPLPAHLSVAVSLLAGSLTTSSMLNSNGLSTSPLTLSVHDLTLISGTAKWLRTKNCSLGTIASLSAESGNSRFRG